VRHLINAGNEPCMPWWRSPGTGPRRCSGDDLRQAAVCGSQYTGTPEHLVPFRAKAVENSDSWCPWLSRAST